MRICAPVLSWFFSVASLAQMITGVVVDTYNAPIFAANVYIKSHPQKGTVTDHEGKFRLRVNSTDDTLVVSYIGYETQEIALSNVDMSQPISVTLYDKGQLLGEIKARAKAPISETFSIIQMSKLDIYLNPVSQGDPLKAITILPASTNTDETANPSLRGSAPGRTRVILNGVPIYHPVTAMQLNNQGFFSLFNTEMIQKQYVYAGNPPLTYGNTSAGLVEIQTIDNLENNQWSISTTLVNTGFFIARKMKPHTSFMQVYGNYVFSDAFVWLQKEKLPGIKSFYAKDAGINFHAKIGRMTTFNSYTYFIDEKFKGLSEQFTYRGKARTFRKRLFTVNNLKILSKNGLFSFNVGGSSSQPRFRFGNIYSRQKRKQIYSSVNYKWLLPANTTLQIGASHEWHRHESRDSIPLYYYALSPNAPNVYLDTFVHHHILETYLYARREINDRFIISSGIRSNLPIKEQMHYLSYQMALKYYLGEKQSFLLSGGKYHSYATPSFFMRKYSLLSTHQVAIDYVYELRSALLKASIYYKHERGEQPLEGYFLLDKVKTWGGELYGEHHFSKSWKLSVSNTLIDQKINVSGKQYPGPKKFDYFLKASLRYNSPKLFSVTLTYLGRPGAYYTQVIGSELDVRTGFYKPIFDDNLYSAQYGRYHRLDVMFSGYIPMKKSALIVFGSVNNIFNFHNERQVQYNADYSRRHYDYYQFRTLFGGLVWRFND